MQDLKYVVKVVVPCFPPHYEIFKFYFDSYKKVKMILFNFFLGFGWEIGLISELDGVTLKLRPKYHTIFQFIRTNMLEYPNWI